MQIGDYCPGCDGGEGNQSCFIARCSMQRGEIAFCFSALRILKNAMDLTLTTPSPTPHQAKGHCEGTCVGIHTYSRNFMKKCNFCGTCSIITTMGVGKIFSTAVYPLDVSELRDIMARFACRKKRPRQRQSCCRRRPIKTTSA